MALSNIITEQYRKQLEDAIAGTREAQRELQLALRAGLDKLPGGENLKPLETSLADNLSKLQQIQNIYFPNG